MVKISEIACFIAQVDDWFNSRQDFQAIFDLHYELGVSIQDALGIWLAQTLEGATLLAGDGTMRTHAKNLGVEVKGMLWISDTLVERKIITSLKAAERLECMLVCGSRLPPKRSCQAGAGWRSVTACHTLAAARTIATIPARSDSGRRSQAKATSAKSCGVSCEDCITGASPVSGPWLKTPLAGP